MRVSFNKNSCHPGAGRDPRLATRAKGRTWIPAFAGMTIILFFITSAFALTVDTPLSDAAQETRARALFYEIRCVVCAGESVADSPAEVARDMRRVIRNRVKAGESDVAIKEYLVSRYGDSVLMRPPLTAATWPLWFGPFIILLAAVWMARRYFARKAA